LASFLGEVGEISAFFEINECGLHAPDAKKFRVDIRQGCSVALMLVNVQRRPGV
jgi:hypothetical protein